MSKNKSPKQEGISWAFMLICIVLTSVVVMAATIPKEKTYTFEGTLPEFIKGDKWIAIAKQAILKSDLPSRDASMIIDSLTEFQNKIVVQINKQLDAEKKLEKPTAIKDSTQKKN